MWSCVVVWDRFLFTGKTLFLGWLLHYLPFFNTGRVTYLHHHFPALYFNILVVPFLLDHLTASDRPRNRRLVFGISFVSVIGVFIYFAPIAYDMGGSANDFSGRKWLQTWNIVD
jgi:dolichyl-phosphate-mannose-protein mannosyltransferase